MTSNHITSLAFTAFLLFGIGEMYKPEWWRMPLVSKVLHVIGVFLLALAVGLLVRGAS